MAQVINTNILSLNAQRNLNNTSGALQTSLQRLSSGLRINSAKDDAAGLAISERFTTQIRGMNQAVRNANDGISLAQVAEGAMGEIGNNLQRIRELAVQARNATNSSADRQALQAEVQQRVDEINRVAEQTQFNGTNLLDGSFANQIFQVGANQGQTITVSSVVDAQSSALGAWEGQLASDDLTAPATTGQDAIAAATFTVNGSTVSLKEQTVGEDTDEARAAARTARVEELAEKLGAIAGLTVEVIGDTDKTGVTVSSASDIVFADADSGNTLDAVFGTNPDTITAEAADFTGFDNVSVESAAEADNAILAMDAALDAINSARGEMGAVQNRFESVVANLSSAVENLSASRSRILDADFAAETAQLTRAQILQQAGISVLSQANAAPQSVLSLLR